MDLLCLETEKVVRAHTDPVILDDPRVVRRMLDTEEQYFVTNNYFGTVQDEITPNMRRLLLNWLLEVCDVEHCENAVFPLTANYLDRYLSKVRVPKKDLQLLGCVCLMLATKLRQSKQMRSGLLVSYTEHSYTVLDIVTWEYEVLNILKWKLASVLPHDYVDTILYRLPEFKCVENMVLSHTRTFQQLIVMEFEFTSWPSSLIALGTIGAAIKGLPNIETVWPHVKNLTELFHEMTAIEINIIDNSIDYIEAFVDKCINNAQKPEDGSASVVAKKRDGDYPPNDNPDTPTDVSDVQF